MVYVIIVTSKMAARSCKLSVPAFVLHSKVSLSNAICEIEPKLNLQEASFTRPAFTL